ncbi:MAG: hypothetical protein PHT69_09460 [Bacteroidales bacterium]|nr:hypothetical protein [Bacteroidales bacterium]
MKFRFLFILIFGTSLTIFSQRNNSFTFVFYNVENLFDTIDTPEINDTDFSPNGSYKWDSEKYYNKIGKIAQVLVTIDSCFPQIVGLCEIENRNVLEDLIQNEQIKSADYKIVHEESPDGRGIDVALLYRSSYFNYISHKAINVSFSDGSETKTRDILYVKGLSAFNDTLHIFVNHWPSRRGGAEESENKRIAAARILRTYIDSIFSINKKANIIITGDFNDNPNNRSITEYLNANSFNRDMQESQIINLHMKPYSNGTGTLVFDNQWFLFDQIMVSKNLAKKKRRGLYLTNFEGKILNSDFLIFTNRQGLKSPNRTYVGNRFVGGYSDHLPVYVKFISK